MNISSPTTRTTAGDEGTENGTIGESEIHDVTVVLTDETYHVQYIETPAINNGVTEKFKVALGSYHVFALVNNPINILAGESIHRVISDWTEMEAEAGFKNGKFFMVNEHNSSSDEKGFPITISASNTENAPAVANIRVDRIAVKIADENSYSTFSTSSIAGLRASVTGLEIEGYVLLNMNKSFNLFQTWGMENNGGETLTDDVLQTPFSSTNLVADQYYKNISNYTELKKEGDEITEIVDLTKGTSYTLGVKYTTENRPQISFYNGTTPTAGRGETSGVIYKVQAKNGSDNAGTFYVYNNRSYTSIDEINALTEFGSVDLTALSPSQLRGKGIKVYEDGVMYYTHYIMDPNTSHQYLGNNYYGIFRNSVYKLKINSFSGLGDDVPGGGTVDPSEEGDPGNPPIDTEEAYIQVTVTIKPWVLNTIEIDF